MFGFTPEAEILNARLAMLGFVIAVGTYAVTGEIIPGVFQDTVSQQLNRYNQRDAPSFFVGKNNGLITLFPTYYYNLYINEVYFAGRRVP